MSPGPSFREQSARRIWFDRKFALGLPLDAFPDVLERLRGTPLRVRERVDGLSSARLTERNGTQWSIQEHVGHLLDLEALWSGWVDDLDDARSTLREADLENRATWEAGHNERNLDDLLNEFADVREALVDRLEAMEGSRRPRTALHPRLQQPMTVVDLMFFVAEHDDHHLAAITQLRGSGT